MSIILLVEKIKTVLGKAKGHSCKAVHTLVYVLRKIVSLYLY